MKIKSGTKFFIDKLKGKIRHIFLDGKVYEFIKEDDNKNQTWKIDEKIIELDRFDAMFGFPFYLRQILAKEVENDNRN